MKKSMRLYLNGTSPFSRLVVIVALELGFEQIDLVWVDPWSSPDALLALNPFSTVPSLEVEAGVALYESVFICDYLLGCGNGKIAALQPNDVPSLRRYALGKSAMETAFKIVVNHRFFKEKTPIAERGELALSRALQSFEASLAEEKGGQPPGIRLADLYLAVALEYIGFRMPEVYASNVGALTCAWLDFYKNRPSFSASTPERLQAQPATLLLVRGF